MAMERCDIQCAGGTENSILRRLSYLLRRSANRIHRWAQRAEQRRQLREMDEHMLKDIGLSRADVQRIAGRRWFWEDPLETGEPVDQRYRSSDRS